MRISVVLEKIRPSRTCVTLLAYSARRIKLQVGSPRGDGRKDGFSSAGLGAARLKAPMGEEEREGQHCKYFRCLGGGLLRERGMERLIVHCVA